MGQRTLKRKIIQALKPSFSGNRERIVVLDAFEELLHLFVVSDRFKGKNYDEIGDMIVPILWEKLEREEWGSICLVKGLAWNEVNGFEPELVEALKRKKRLARK